MKRTVENNWIHVLCAIWTPEIPFVDPERLEGAVNVARLPPRAWANVGGRSAAERRRCVGPDAKRTFAGFSCVLAAPQPCKLCKETAGAVAQCAWQVKDRRCNYFFHIPCAQRENLAMVVLTEEFTKSKQPPALQIWCPEHEPVRPVEGWRARVGAAGALVGRCH